MTNYKIGNNIGNTNNIRKGDLPDDFKIRHKNFTAIAFQLELTPCICMIRAKVKLVWIAARTGAKREIGFYIYLLFLLILISIINK